MTHVEYLEKRLAICEEMTNVLYSIMQQALPHTNRVIQDAREMAIRATEHLEAERDKQC
jgi:hypothetical protein